MAKRLEKRVDVSHFPSYPPIRPLNSLGNNSRSLANFNYYLFQPPIKCSVLCSFSQIKNQSNNADDWVDDWLSIYKG